MPLLSYFGGPPVPSAVASLRQRVLSAPPCGETVSEDVVGGGHRGCLSPSPDPCSSPEGGRGKDSYMSPLALSPGEPGQFHQNVFT